MGEPDQRPKSKEQPPEALLSPEEVAALFRVDPKTITRWAKAGKLSQIRTLGGHRRYRETEVRQLLRAAGADDVTERSIEKEPRTSGVASPTEKERILQALLAPEPMRELTSAGAIDSGHSDLSERIEELLYEPLPAVRDGKG